MTKAPQIHPLRRWLFENQITQVEFAIATGISQSYLSDLIVGRKRPSLDVVEVIARATSGAITAAAFEKPAT
jgi:predicted transcriptional regulator